MKINCNLRKLATFAFLLIINTLSTQEVIELPRFDKMVITGKVNVNIAQGNSEQAILKARNFDEDDIKITVDEGVLKINLLKSLVKGDRRIEVDVTYKKLRAIKGQAGAEVYAQNVVKADYLELKARSGAEVELKVEADDLLMIASEGGKIDITGTAESHETKAISGGEIHAYQLKTNYAYASSNTGGLVEVEAKERIEATASTGGRIHYKGDPAKTKVKDFLGGIVREM